VFSGPGYQPTKTIASVPIALTGVKSKQIDETVTMDKSGANLAALQAINAERETRIRVRQGKYLNNIVEQDHRAIKRRTRAHDGLQGFPVCAHYPLRY
jgi:transposase-like protein